MQQEMRKGSLKDEQARRGEELTARETHSAHLSPETEGQEMEGVQRPQMASMIPQKSAARNDRIINQIVCTDEYGSRDFSFKARWLGALKEKSLLPYS